MGSYIHNKRAHPVMLGFIHNKSIVEAAGSSLTYIKIQKKGAIDEELEFRRNFLGSVLKYDSKIQVFLNGSRENKVEFTNDERAMRSIFRSLNWCVFRSLNWCVFRCCWET